MTAKQGVWISSNPEHGTDVLNLFHVRGVHQNEKKGTFCCLKCNKTFPHKEFKTIYIIYIKTRLR